MPVAMCGAEDFERLPDERIAPMIFPPRLRQVGEIKQARGDESIARAVAPLSNGERLFERRPGRIQLPLFEKQLADIAVTLGGLLTLPPAVRDRSANPRRNSRFPSLEAESTVPYR